MKPGYNGWSRVVKFQNGPALQFKVNHNGWQEKQCGSPLLSHKLPAQLSSTFLQWHCSGTVFVGHSVLLVLPTNSKLGQVYLLCRSWTETYSNMQYPLYPLYKQKTTTDLETNALLHQSRQFGPFLCVNDTSPCNKIALAKMSGKHWNCLIASWKRTFNQEHRGMVHGVHGVHQSHKNWRFLMGSPILSSKNCCI
jgi:hypothetical protein